MRKNLGVQPAIFPMPVLMVAAYDENGVADVMNAAWGMITPMWSIGGCICSAPIPCPAGRRS